MTEETNQKVYAKVHDDGYIEFPIYAVHIAARNQSVSDYQEVIFGRKPEVPEFYTLKSDLYVYDGRVRYDFSVQPIPLSTLLRTANNNETNEDVYFATIDTALATRIYNLISDYVDDKLEEFAKTRGYKSVVSCVSYIGDPNPQFDSDALIMRELRSQVWVTMNAYSGSIINNTTPIPKSMADIDSNIPPLSWE